MPLTQSIGELKREAAAEPEPQLSDLLSGVGNSVKALGDTVGGLLNSVGNALVVNSNKRPEPNFEYKPPRSSDSRGPCPGLNLLANCKSINQSSKQYSNIADCKINRWLSAT